MTETGFGAGGYAATFPNVPTLEATVQSAREVRVTIGPEGNPPETEYAVYNVFYDTWFMADGGWGTVPAWRTSAAWAMATLGGLVANTFYALQVKARNSGGVETELGGWAEFITCFDGELGVEVTFSVVKAVPAITAPAFMAGLPVSIRLAGKSLDDLGFHVDRIGGLDLPRVVADEIFIPGDHIWQTGHEYFALKRIVIEGHIHGTSPDDLRLRIAYLKSFLMTFEGAPWRSRSPVALERADLGDRRWSVLYESMDLVETGGKRDTSSSARVRIAMKSLSPFACANGVTRVTFSPAAGEFHALDLGTAPSDAVYTIRGPAVNPSFSVGDMLFFCDFSDGLAFTGADTVPRTGTFTPAGDEPAAYRPADAGMGILVTHGNTVQYTASGNPGDGSWISVVEPRWSSSARTENAVMLEHHADANNRIRLFWDGMARKWAFSRLAGGKESVIHSPVQAFPAGTRIVLGITMDQSTADGMRLYVNGEPVASGGGVAVLQKAPEYVTLHANDCSLVPDAIFGLVAGWSRALSPDEMLRVADNPTALSNGNVTVSWTGTLDDGDLLILDSVRRTAERYGAATGTRENVLAALSGDIPVIAPGRCRNATDRTRTMIATHTAATEMEVRYRRRYL